MFVLLLLPCIHFSIWRKVKSLCSKINGMSSTHCSSEYKLQTSHLLWLHGKQQKHDWPYLVECLLDGEELVGLLVGAGPRVHPAPRYRELHLTPTNTELLYVH